MGQMKYGIYCLPYHMENGEWLDGEEYAVMEYDKIECIYPLGMENGTVLALQENGDRFLMITKEADILVLLVVKKIPKRFCSVWKCWNIRRKNSFKV